MLPSTSIVGLRPRPWDLASPLDVLKCPQQMLGPASAPPTDPSQLVVEDELELEPISSENKDNQTSDITQSQADDQNRISNNTAGFDAEPSSHHDGEDSVSAAAHEIDASSGPRSHGSALDQVPYITFAQSSKESDLGTDRLQNSEDDTDEQNPAEDIAGENVFELHEMSGPFLSTTTGIEGRVTFLTASPDLGIHPSALDQVSYNALTAASDEHSLGIDKVQNPSDSTAEQTAAMEASVEDVAESDGGTDNEDATESDWESDTEDVPESSESSTPIITSLVGAKPSVLSLKSASELRTHPIVFDQVPENALVEASEMFHLGTYRVERPQDVVEDQNLEKENGIKDVGEPDWETDDEDVDDKAVDEPDKPNIPMTTTRLEAQASVASYESASALRTHQPILDNAPDNAPVQPNEVFYLGAYTVERPRDVADDHYLVSGADDKKSTEPNELSGPATTTSVEANEVHFLGKYWVERSDDVMDDRNPAADDTNHDDFAELHPSSGSITTIAVETDKRVASFNSISDTSTRLSSVWDGSYDNKNAFDDDESDLTDVSSSEDDVEVEEHEEKPTQLDTSEPSSPPTPLSPSDEDAGFAPYHLHHTPITIRRSPKRRRSSHPALLLVQAENEHLKSELEQLKTEHHERDLAYQRVAAKQQVTEDDNKQLRQQNAGLDNENIRLLAEKTQLKNDNTVLQTENVQLKNVQNAMRKHNSTVDVVPNTSNVLDEVSNEFRDQRESRSKLTHKHENVRTEPFSKDSELGRTKEELADTRNQLVEAEAELDVTNEALITAMKDLTSTTIELKSARGTLESTRNSLASTKNELGSTTSELGNTKAELKRIVSALAAKDTIYTKNIQILSLRARVHFLERWVDNLYYEKAAFSEETNALMQEKSEWLRQKKIWAEEKKDMLEDREAMLEEKEERKQVLKELQRDYERLEKVVDGMCKTSKHDCRVELEVESLTGSIGALRITG